MGEATEDERRESIRLIRDSAGAIAPRGGDTRRIRALRFKEPGFDRAVLRQMAELGWIGLAVPEEAGGAGLGMGEYCALAEELGGGLAPEPLIPCALAARLLAGGAEAAPVLAGERVVIPAWAERPGTLDAAGDTRIAGGRATGRKLFVPMAAGADAFLVTGEGGALLVARDAPGVALTTERTQDGGHYGTLTLENAPGTPVACDPGPALDEAALATAASLLGIMERALALSLDYLRTRRQFGKPIGSFQALQHRAADLRIQTSLTRASVESAAAALDAGVSREAARAAVSRAKARASDAALLVTRQGIQMHGGIGYTDEADIGLYLRRAMVLAGQYGSASVHRARYAALTPETEDV